MAGAPVGWYPDPSGRHQNRYWDGKQWTDRVSEGGLYGTDDLNGQPSAVRSGLWQRFQYWYLHPVWVTDRNWERDSIFWLERFIGNLLVRLVIPVVLVFAIVGLIIKQM
jgi:hypothetical protein